MTHSAGHEDAKLVNATPRHAPELTKKAMLVTVVAITALTAVAITLLWWLATKGLTGGELVRTRLDALKIGLSVGVGSGGVVALYLSWRRQRSTESDLDNRERALSHQFDILALQREVANDVRADATQRRITDLYTTAVEQLGSEKAPVRLGGLYALERLGQDNEDQRETIVNVMCAYLRMPYLPPGVLPDKATPEQRERYGESTQEAQVRLTAQRILHRHHRGDAAHELWDEVLLDLVGAYLVGLNFAGADLRGADLSEANLSDGEFGSARMTGATLRRANFKDASLERAKLDGVDLTGANLIDANLSGVDLTGARLVRAKLLTAKLTRAKLSRADLIGADFTGAHLEKVNLAESKLMLSNLLGADLREADLTGANLRGATLTRANLAKAKMSGAIVTEVDLSEVELPEGYSLRDGIVVEVD